MFSDLGLTFVSIDQAKIRLNSLFMQHIYDSLDDLTFKISKHYQRQFLNQFLRLFGSFDLLGNPVSLIENLGTGVIDMFYEPIYGLVKGKGVY
jgi:vacuolar protein sorting-associated protein 13A/C